MSKNMTRKGLAFGATFALGAGLISGVPAVAAGTADGSVTLLPNVGAEYVVRSGDYFDLKANYDASLVASNRFLKFLVEDAGSDTVADVDINGATNDTGVNTQVVSLTAATTVASDKITYTAADHGFVVGDTVTIAGAAAATGTTAGPSAAFPIVAPVTADTFTVGAGSGTGAVTLTNATATLTSTTFSAITFSGTTATMTVLNASNLMVGDVITVAGLAGAGNGDVNGDRTITKVVSSTSIQFTAASSAPVVTLDATAANNKITLKTPDTGANNGLASRADLIAMPLGANRIIGRTADVSARDADDNSYVVKGIDNSVANDQVLRLVSTDTANTVSVNVTAWVDNNGNDLIDPTEKASATRTVSFLKATDIAATTTIRPATAGESSVVADVVFTPVLNGLMVLANEGEAANAVTPGNTALVKFTRQGDTTVLANTANASYSNVTKKWTFTSQAFNSSNWADTAATKVTPGANGAIGSAGNYFIKTAAVSATGVVTMTTGEYISGDSAWTAKAHGLRVGDKIVITDEATGTQVWESATAVTITSVPTTSTFTFKTTSTTAVAETDLGTTTTTEARWTVDTYIRDKVEAGALTAQFFFDNTGSATVSSTPVSPIASYSVGAKVVGSAGLAIVGAASSTVNAAGKVAKAATTANFVVTVKDADGDAVGAGVDVTMTAQRTAGISTITANGLAVGSAAATTFYGKTDANGQVAIALTNSVGAVGDTVALTANSQGATQATLSAVWEDKVYTIHDINDANYDNSVRSRSVLAGASYPITFLVQDQWKGVAGDDIRIKVSLSGRTVQTSIVELTNGVGSLTVVDGGLTTGDTTITVVGQKKSAVTGLWADTDASFIDWDGSGGSPADIGTVAVKYQTASAIVFNANGANFPSTTAADHTADVTTLTPVALDQRVSNTAAPAFKAAEKAVVSGSVTLANGVLATGSMVTVASPGVAFKAGNVWALDSITFVTDGTFAVEAYSRTSGAKVVTVTSGAATKTQSITFNAIASTKGYSVVLTAADSVKSGSTMKVEGQILDANGNGIPVLTAGTGAAATLSVSYLGLGLVSGALPTTTDKDGKFYFYVLVGTNDKGTATVTASYDADGTGTTSAAATVSKTIYVGQDAPGEAKVNAGSFKGYVALYAKGYAGKRMSAKVGKDWVVVPVLASNFERVVEFTGAGYTISVPIYIDRVLVDTITVTTK